MSPKVYLPLDPPPSDEPRWKKQLRARRHREFMEMGTWAEFRRKHLSEGLWGRTNLVLTWIGAIAGLVYGITLGASGLLSLLLTVAFTVTVGCLIGMFVLPALVVGAVVATVGGVVWLAWQGITLVL
jgi:hypothetical protein